MSGSSPNEGYRTRKLVDGMPVVYILGVLNASIMSDGDYVHDYAAVNYPSDRDHEPGAMDDFDAAQRRAWLLNRIYELGTPQRINQSEVCDYFDVPQSIISRDLRTEITPYIEDKLGDRARMMSDVVFKSAVEQLMDKDEPYKAAKTMKLFNEWLQSTGEQDSETATDEIEVTFGDDS